MSFFYIYEHKNDDVLIIDYTDLNPHLNGSMTLITEPYGHGHFDDVLVEEIK